MTSLKIGYSPCPNDTFIFAALAEQRLDAPLEFQPVLADVETLNQWALERRLAVTKLSFMALGSVRDSYGLLSAGGALGRGCGPLLVARPGTTLAGLDSGVVAAPGNLTTARLLLGLFCGRTPSFKQMVFSEIMPAVARGEADFGLVIHEGRFTYPNLGLEALLDLGAWWEEKTGLPIPLGGIAIRRDLGPEVARQVDRSIRTSLETAMSAPDEAMGYVLAHAQEMDRQVVMQHIDLYVNSFGLDLGPAGRNAVETLFSIGEDAGLIPLSTLPLMAY
ncbi:MAG: 1,4-dihydroxy-6-naphthoate synthase [Desulfomonile tiedjei]|nr:1,4-dihydroxy-6-naphthoate synthase [Desulfomonile tiedjei]